MDHDFDHELSATEVPKTVLVLTGKGPETEVSPDSGENSTVDFKRITKSSASKSPNVVRLTVKGQSGLNDNILVIGNSK